MINAAEARAIVANRHQTEMSLLEERIRQYAEGGAVACLFSGLSDWQITRLEAAGYRVIRIGTSRDSDNVQFRVDWAQTKTKGRKTVSQTILNLSATRL